MTDTPFHPFGREAWAALRGQTPMTLTQDDVDELRSIHEELSLAEVEAIYLPLSRLLNLHITAVQELYRVSSRFLGTLYPRVPYAIAIAGSVSAGKSTTARVLRTLLSRWPDHPRVELVATDGFLFPNEVLQQRNLMERKGFPESYDRGRLLRFLTGLKSGVPRLEVPVYSHIHYDIVPDRYQEIAEPDILILEGLNVLQGGPHAVYVSDFMDFSIYIDAAEEHLERWFLDRFRRLRETAFRDPESFFRFFVDVPEEEAMRMAASVWERINLANLRENVLPTRERARLILEKRQDHSIGRILMRRI